MSSASLAGVAGGALLAVNEWTGPDRGIFGGVLWDGKDPDAAHRALVRLGGELLLVAVLAVLASQGGAWTTLVIAVLVGLWVLWFINRKG